MCRKECLCRVHLLGYSCNYSLRRHKVSHQDTQRTHRYYMPHKHLCSKTDICVEKESWNIHEGIEGCGSCVHIPLILLRLSLQLVQRLSSSVLLYKNNFPMLVTKQMACFVVCISTPVPHSFKCRLYQQIQCFWQKSHEQILIKRKGIL